jgi:hypothetical protein
MAVPLLFGPYGGAALSHIDRLAAFGANALWFHGFNAEAFEACARHGITPCVEFKTFRADLDAHPELVPTGVDGKPIRYERLVQGVCLSNEAFLQETEANLIEGLEGYAPAGIWLDYLTYAGWFEAPEPDLQESCFCPACVAQFNEATGVDATSPGEILTHHADAWTRHKCKRIAGFGERYASLIRERRPGCIVGAYMCPWTPDEYDGALGRIFAQDYELLAPAIDVFTPLIYCQKSGRASDWGRAFLEHAPAFVPTGRKVQLILDALDYPDSLTETAASLLPTWGVQMFGGDRVFADEAWAKVFAQAVDQIRLWIES